MNWLWVGRKGTILFLWILIAIAVKSATGDVRNNWGNRSVVDYGEGSTPAKSRNGMNWGRTGEVEFSGHQPPPRSPAGSGSMAPVIGTNSVVNFSAGNQPSEGLVVDPDYASCGLHCLENMPPERAKAIFEGAKPVVGKIVKLIRYRSNRAISLELLGKFCTSKEVDRTSGVNEQDCVDRFFEVHRFWYEFVKNEIGKGTSK